VPLYEKTTYSPPIFPAILRRRESLQECQHDEEEDDYPELDD
jgi:hypothetical protein